MHVYALSIGASVLLSFFPFLIVMLTLIRDVFHFPAAERALILALGDYFPGDLGAFIIRNLTKVNHGRYQMTSLLLLLFTANGIFEPLEVALNRAWRVPNNRSYIRNQMLSFFLIILCGGLALASVLLTAVNTKFVATQYGIKVFPVWLSLGDLQSRRDPDDDSFAGRRFTGLLPNRRVPVRRVLPVAVLVGIALESWKYRFPFRMALDGQEISERVRALLLCGFRGGFQRAHRVHCAGGRGMVRAAAERIRRTRSVVRRKQRGRVPVDFRHRSRFRPWHPHISETEHCAVRASLKTSLLPPACPSSISFVPGGGGVVRGFDPKTHQQPVHMSARTDALHNLLPQIAAFLEMQRVHLLRFLRQSVLRDVAAVPRNEVLDAHCLGICCRSGDGARAFDRCGGLIFAPGRAVDANAMRACGRNGRHQKLAGSAHARTDDAAPDIPHCAAVSVAFGPSSPNENVCSVTSSSVTSSAMM